MVLDRGVAQNQGTSHIVRECRLDSVQEPEVTLGQYRETEKKLYEKFGNLHLSVPISILTSILIGRLYRLHFQASLWALISSFLVPTSLVKPLRRYHTRLLAEIAMALLRYVRGWNCAYWSCGLWVRKGVFVRFSEDDITGAADDTSA